MKKLMMFAAAMTIVGSAFAQAALQGISVYDYKASVKNTDLKIVSVRDPVTGLTVQINTKLLVSNTFTGYIIAEDCDDCAGLATGRGAAVAVLVRKGDRTMKPYVLPAVLKMVKAFDKTGKLLVAPATVKSSEIEMGLWIGNDTKFAVGVPTVTTTPIPANYSEGLFGISNIDDPVNPGGFVDAWLDASGFGKAVNCTTTGIPCNWGGSSLLTASASGSVIGAMYLCVDPSVPVCTDNEVETIGQNSWVTGTWSIKRTTKLNVAVSANTLDAAITTAVATASKGAYTWDDTTSTVIAD